MVGKKWSAGVGPHELEAADGRGHRIPCDFVEDTTIQPFLPQRGPDENAVRPQFLNIRTPAQVRQSSIQESEAVSPIGGPGTQLSHQASVEASVQVYTVPNNSIPIQVRPLLYLNKTKCLHVV